MLAKRWGERVDAWGRAQERQLLLSTSHPQPVRCQNPEPAHVLSAPHSINCKGIPQSSLDTCPTPWADWKPPSESGARGPQADALVCAGCRLTTHDQLPTTGLPERAALPSRQQGPAGGGSEQEGGQ